MSKQKNLTPRRQKPPKSGKMLRAITGKNRPRKHRAVAAQGATAFQSEESGLATKIVLGLIILVVFHVVAVGAIAMHSNYFQNSQKAALEESLGKPLVIDKKDLSARERIARERQIPKITKNQPFVWVSAGETYKSIAESQNVDLAELKALNNNRPLKAGVGLKIPSRKVEVVSREVEAVGSATRPSVSVVQGDVHMISDGSERVEINSRQPSQAAANYHVHTFQEGETFWSLSIKYNTSVDSIQKANPNLSPTKIRVGNKINIPR